MNRRLDLAALGGFAALCLYHAGVVWRTAVDIPYWDDWDALLPGAMSRAWSWSWLLRRHTESRIIPTKLLFWLGLRLDGFDIRAQVALNLAAFALTLFAVERMMRRAAPSMALWIRLSFLAFALSPRAHEALEWAMASPQVLGVLGWTAAALLLLPEEPLRAFPWAGAACALAAMNAHFDGFLGCAAVAAALAARAWRARERPALAAAVAVSAALALCALDFTPHPPHPPGILPTRGMFWRFYWNLIAWGFGMDQLSPVLGAVCAAAALWPLASAAQAAWRGERRSVLLLACAGAVLVTLAGVSYGRAGFGEGYAKASRYAHLVVWLVPLSACAWHRKLEGSTRRGAALAALWAFAFLGHADNWDFSIYSRVRLERELGADCVRDYYRAAGPPSCPMIYHSDLRAPLERARELRLSFYRTLGEGRP